MKISNIALSQENNKVYKSQFAILAMIASFTFKVVMLPSYMMASAQNLAFVAFGLMMILDTIMYGIVYFIASNINLIKERNPWLMAPVMLALFIAAFSRLQVLLSETVNYSSTTLFDQGKINFIVISILPVLAYIVFKGGKVIGRLGQISFYIAAVAIGGTMLLLRAKLDLGALLPLNTGWDGVVNAIDDHYFWFGDFLPLLFLHVVPSEGGKQRKWIMPVTLLLIFIGGILFMILFTMIYGDAGQYTAFAFNKIAIFNKVSQLIGPTNFPIIIAWILMAIVKLSLLIYASVMSLNYFIKKNAISVAVVVISTWAIVTFALPNTDLGYKFATSWMRYVVASITYIVPITLLIYTIVIKKQRSASLLPVLSESRLPILSKADKKVEMHAADTDILIENKAIHSGFSTNAGKQFTNENGSDKSFKKLVAKYKERKGNE